jgi:hypothetical protein
MAKTAMTELERQIEEVRHEAYAAGYRTAMQAIRDAAARLAPDTRTTVATSSRRGRGRARRREAAPRPTSKARSRTTASAARPRRSATGRSPRGANAPLVEEVLRAAAPKGASQTEIRNAMQEKGVSISFTSIRNALRQLEARNAAEQAGDGRTWWYRGGAG